MNKKGFTLIEIIVVMGLLSIIGVAITITIVKVNDKKEKDILVAKEKDFNNALEVYLETHSEVLNNVNNKYEGAIITLETLKNEGLINSDLELDYKKNYYIVSNALLSDKTDLETNVVKEECDNRIAINKIASWVKDKDYSDSSVLYFCHKQGGDEGPITPVINDPYKDCSSNDKRLYCKVIKSAKNESEKTLEENVEDDLTKLSIFSDERTVYRETPLTEIKATPKVLQTSDMNDIKTIDLVFTLYYNPENPYSIKENAIFLLKTIVHKDANRDWAYLYQYDDSYVIYNDSGAKKIKLSNHLNWSDFISSEKYKKQVDDYNKHLGLFALDYNELRNLIGKYFVFFNWNQDGKSSNVFQLLNVRKISSDRREFKIRVFNNGSTEKAKNIEKTMSKSEDVYGKDEYDNELYGYSYYFRGDVKDNYVNFNNMCWRILRVEGDGSTKLILEDMKSTCKNKVYNVEINEYNTDFTDWEKNHGSIYITDMYNIYGYVSVTKGGSHSHEPTKHVPIYNSSGMLYSNLTEWFDTKFKNTLISKYLKSENFCLGNSKFNHETYLYEYNDTPSFVCEDNHVKTYNNDYITTITADEAYFSGGHYSFISTSNKLCYERNLFGFNSNLYCRDFATLTTDGTYVYSLRENWYNSSVWELNPFEKGYVKPVIVLKNSIEYVRGNGTINDAYEIKAN